MKPFKNKEVQKYTSLVVGLTGLLIVASTLNTDPSPGLNLGSIFISYKLIGGLLFIAGLIYLINAISD